jgi:hypothetical protein
VIALELVLQARRDYLLSSFPWVLSLTPEVGGKLRRADYQLSTFI